MQANHALLKEIREINRQLINTVVVSNDEDVDPSAAATAEGDEGTIFKCSFEAVALSPSLKSKYASGKMVGSRTSMQCLVTCLQNIFTSYLHAFNIVHCAVKNSATKTDCSHQLSRVLSDTLGHVSS